MAREPRRIAIVQGHPDPAGGHFVHALAGAYERAAREVGHQVKRIDVARLELPLLRNAQEWASAPPTPAVAGAQQAMAWAQHLVIFYPLWLGDMPAGLKGFFEHVMRPGFAIGEAAPGRMPKKLLKGRSARVVVTMGMPALFYKVYYRAHSLKSLQRNILAFCGYSPVRSTLIGMVEGPARAREDWLTKLAVLGTQGA
jgi:putative NADPH-quinone reductase